MAKSATRKSKGKTPGFGRGVTMAASLAHALALSRAGHFAQALAEFDRAIDRFGPTIELLYDPFETGEAQRYSKPPRA